MRIDGTDDEVLWQQDRMHAGVRNAARLVLGLGSTIAVGLFVAAFVVGADTRSTLLVALGLLVIFGGGFVGFVWSADVGIENEASWMRRRGHAQAPRTLSGKTLEEMAVPRGFEPLSGA